MLSNYIPNSIRRIWDWFNLADYDAAKDKGSNDIIARYGRGNINFQNGSVLDDADLRSLSEAGDRAIQKLNDRARIA